MKQQLLDTIQFYRSENTVKRINRLHLVQLAIVHDIIERMDEAQLLTLANFESADAFDQCVRVWGGMAKNDRVEVTTEERCPHGVLRVATCLACVRESSQPPPPPKGA